MPETLQAGASMIAQDQTGQPVELTSPRRTPAAVALLTSLVVAATPVVAACWPGSPAVLVRAAGPTAPSDPGGVIFRVVPAPPTPQPPTPQPPTPGPPTPQPPTPGPTPSGGQLPVTGDDPVPGWLPGLGALLVLGGALAVTAVRKRPRRSGER